MSYYPPPAYPPPPVPPKKKRHTVRTVAIVAGALIVVGTIAGALGTGGKKTAAPTAQTTSSMTPSKTAPVAPPVVESTPDPTPSPDATYEGTCDYELSTDFDNYETHAADLNGEVDVENTGNVSNVVRVKITWPQLGHAPIVMRKTVKVAYGKTVTARFTQPVGQSEIDRLQSWQEGHNFKDGCTYGATITDTFGTVH